MAAVVSSLIMCCMVCDPMWSLLNFFLMILLIPQNINCNKNIRVLSLILVLTVIVVRVTRMFSVVEFSEPGGGLAVVHCKWFTPLKRQVFWPPYKDNKSYIKALKKGEEISDKWALFPVTKCYYTTDDYEIACNKLKVAEVTSDLQTEEEQEEFSKYSSAKRKVSRPIRFEEDDDEEPNKRFLPRPPHVRGKNTLEESLEYTPPCGKKSQKIHSAYGDSPSRSLSQSAIVQGSVRVTSGITRDLELLQEATPRRILQPSTSRGTTQDLELLQEATPRRILQPSTSRGTTQDLELLQEATPRRILQPSTSKDTNNCVEGQGKSVFEILLTNLLEIKQQNKKILSILEKKNTDRITCSLPKDLNIEFPIRTSHDIDKLEAYLSNQESVEGSKAVVSYWSSLGGKDTASKTTRILREVLHDSVASKYNFYGRHSKKPFSELKINSEIISAVKISCDTSTREVENIIKIWLKHAPERLRKQELKELRNRNN